MGFFDGVFTTNDPPNAGRGILDFLGFGSGKGTVATAKSALTLSAFYNGVDQISNDVAKLPKGVYIKDGDSRNTLNSHPVNYLISMQPNEMMTAFDFWKVIVVLVIIKGNAFVRIVRNRVTGDVEQLLLLDNGDVEIIKDKKIIRYSTKLKKILFTALISYILKPGPLTV